jgi:PAS domain S-box-containing protein
MSHTDKLARVSRCLFEKPGLPFEEIRKRRLFAVLLVPGTAIMFSFGLSHLLHRNHAEGLLDCIYGLWLAMSLVLFRFVDRGQILYRLNAAFLGLVFLFLAVKGGAGANRMMWVFSFPLIAFYTLGKLEGLVWTSGILGVLVTVMYAPTRAPAHAYEPEFKLRFCAAFFLVSAFSYIYESVREHSQKNLENERNKLRAETTKLASISAKLREVNAALKASEERLKRAQAIAHVGNLEYDFATEMVWGSEEALRILGVGIGRSVFAVTVMRDLIADHEAFRTLFEARVRARQDLEVEVPVRRASDGKTIVLHAKVELTWDADGKPGKAVGVIQDVSERKHAEEDRRDLEARLARSRKMEALGVLAGGVAHDLNNVLSGIVSLPDALLIDLPPDNELVEPLATIRDSGKRAAAIVQDLLTLARRGVTSRKVLNLNDVVAECMASPQHAKLKSFHPRVKFEVQLDTDLLNMKGSDVHLRTSVMNLISNAAEAMPAGGRVRVRTENRYVDRAANEQGDVEEGEYAVFRVEDEGIGISQEDLDRIFEPFYTKKKMGRSGTGLGMAVVWGTVQDHRGHVHVDSEEGRGTTIELMFPATRESLDGREGTVPVDEYVGRGEALLVVDDVSEQRDLAKMILTKLNYVTEAVPSGEAAVEYLSSRSADLVILDMIMDPGIDGLETYSRILREHPAQRAIIVSGFSETDRVREAQRLGATGYVKKPYTLETLGLAVRGALDR